LVWSPHKGARRRPIQRRATTTARLTEWFGVGPLLEFSVGTYLREKGTTEERVSFDRAPSGPTTHFWLFVGGRVVVMP
jgi:hypothetical protein